MIKDNYNIQFSGLTHDHTTIISNNRLPISDNDELKNTCSAIAILRRHPMYDCLMLVKKYRACLNGYSLEFPADRVQEDEVTDSEIGDSAQPATACNRHRLVSRFLDGDDPMFQACCVGSTSAGSENSQSQSTQETDSIVTPFMAQVDDKGDTCELVHVPINGLLDRLEGYTRTGVAVDSRVYAFAMGLKTAERIMTTKSMKELQETPI